DPDVAEGDGAMVPLEQDRAGRELRIAPVVPRRIGQFLVVMNGLAIQHHLEEPGVRDLPPLVVESWSLELDVERLPFTGRPGGVDPRRIAVVDVMVSREQQGPRVDPTAVAGRRLLATPAIGDLDLVVAVELDP